MAHTDDKAHIQYSSSQDSSDVVIFSSHQNNRDNGSLYLSITPKFYTEVLLQTLNPTAKLWCKTLSRIKVDLVLHRT